MNNVVPCSWDLLKHPDLWAVLVKLHWHGFVYCTSCQDVPCISDTGGQTLHTLLVPGQSLCDNTHAEFAACACHNLKCNYSRPFWTLLWVILFYYENPDNTLSCFVFCFVLWKIHQINSGGLSIRSCTPSWCSSGMPRCTRPARLWDAHVTAARCTESAAERCCACSHPIWGRWVKMDKSWCETWLFSSSHLRGSGVWALFWHHQYRILYLAGSASVTVVHDSRWCKISFDVLETACGPRQIVFSVFRVLKVFAVPLSILTCKEKSPPGKSLGEKYWWMKMF